jgi:hypothetical protein
MAEKLTIITERVDDIPLLLAQLERMGVQPLLDEHFPTHGNWVGLRACLRSWHASQPTDHEVNHGHADHGFTGLR